MSRDRLASHRATRQHHDPEPVELTEAGSSSNSRPSFLVEVASIQDQITRIEENVKSVSEQQQRALGAVERPSGQEPAPWDPLVVETRRLINDTKDRIKSLGNGREGRTGIERNRLALTNKKFLDAIKNYQRVEQDFQARTHEQMERQIRIVKPDATPAEVAAVIQGGGQQIFAEALSSSSQYADSRAAYKAVQERQLELQRLEQTLAELGQLFIDVATLMEEQNEALDHVESVMKDVEANTAKGAQHAGDAVEHAKNWRRWRKVLFFIILFVVVVLALVLGIFFGTHHGSRSGQ
ncbi:t-SNARE [Pluteus cervinus]|uniref:t-SNARE n=1 Tax=Pluteus cervinus TaxID=181527 RepID=A0ACD3BF30_9AGAR|nr:t-SNARE [Pluteus cervinus]